MLTGLQLRAARELLGLQPSKLAERMRVPTRVIKTAESVAGECPVTVATAFRIQAYLERCGIEFLPDGCGSAARFVEQPPTATSGETVTSDEDMDQSRATRLLEEEGRNLPPFAQTSAVA